MYYDNEYNMLELDSEREVRILMELLRDKPDATIGDLRWYLQVDDLMQEVREELGLGKEPGDEF